MTPPLPELAELWRREGLAELRGRAERAARAAAGYRVETPYRAVLEDLARAWAAAASA